MNSIRKIKTEIAELEDAYHTAMIFEDFLCADLYHGEICKLDRKLKVIYISIAMFIGILTALSFYFTFINPLF